jgi:putative inner membrane exporter YdcZ
LILNHTPSGDAKISASRFPKEGIMGAFIFALLSGAAITAQAGSNSQLKQSLRDPISALAINYVLGLSSVVVVMVFARVSLPTMDRLGSAPWWAWLGGVLGAFYGLIRGFSRKSNGGGHPHRRLSRVNFIFGSR